jgi:hypothetical protein
MKIVTNRLQLFPHGGGWTIFYEGTFSFTGVINDFAKALLVAKDLARKNCAQLLVRDEEGEVLLNTSFKS